MSRKCGLNINVMNFDFLIILFSAKLPSLPVFLQYLSTSLPGELAEHRSKKHQRKKPPAWGPP